MLVVCSYVNKYMMSFLVIYYWQSARNYIVLHLANIQLYLHNKKLYWYKFLCLKTYFRKQSTSNKANMVNGSNGANIDWHKFC